MKRSLSLIVLAASFITAAAHADTFKISYLAAGVQASTAPNTSTETFNATTTGKSAGYTTTFGNSGITGTYSGNFSFANADLYGGANGTGNYITTGFGSQYTLTLNQNVNYFGLWVSALDAGNDLKFYNGSTLLLDFTGSQLSSATGSCPGSAYCGNPNSGQDQGEQFAFINFYNSTGTFNKIVFSETLSNAGFESDNHTIGNICNTPGGTPLSVTPEPSSLALLGTGILGVAGYGRRRILGAR